MATSERTPKKISSAEEAIDLAVAALRLAYGPSVFDVRDVSQRNALWVVELHVPLFGLRRVTIRNYDGVIEKVETVSTR